MQPGPDTGFGSPVGVARRSRPSSPPPLQERPASHTLAQHVDDARQCSPVWHPKLAWVLVPSLGLRWQQWGYALPQVFSDEIIGHLADPADEDHQLPADTPVSAEALDSATLNHPGRTSISRGFSDSTADRKSCSVGS